MDKKARQRMKAATLLERYSLPQQQTIKEAINRQAMAAVTEQHGKDIPPGSYAVNVDYSSLELRVLNNPAWHPLPMDICVSSGLVEDRLAFTARTSSHGYMRFTVRLSQLDNGANARVIQCEHPIAVSRTLATLPDCGWLLPQLLAAREQHQADLWAIIKGDKQ